MTAKKKNTPAEIAITSREIAGRILFVRGVQVILDSHIAELYGVETRRLNEQVKRNEARFPEHFRFQLTEEEWEGLSLQSDPSNSPDSLRSQNATFEPRENLKSQNATSSHGGRRSLPYVFSEQGVAMLSAVLRSETAVQVSIRIMEAFVQMRRYFLQNATLFQKIEQVETRQLKHIADSDEKFNRLFNALEDQSQKSPAQGIFFNGQIFDAYAFASDRIREARTEIILIDNYIDDSVFTLLSKRSAKTQATLYTRKISKTLQLDLEKHNAQYPVITLQTLTGFHDRFLIIDGKALYHLGASLKDLGKQCFAFSRMDDLLPEIIAKLK